jgi:dolichol-phosphate mannosyltransferase
MTSAADSAVAKATADQGLQLSIVVPTFNEAPNIRELLRRLEAALRATRWEVIFVDDDSPDGTAALVRDIARTDPRVRCLHRIGRRGLSTACIEGMLASSAPVIAVMDADLQHDEQILPTMLAAICADAAGAQAADLVVATRYGQGGGVGNWDESRQSLSRIATMVSRSIVRQAVSDPMSGFFMLHRRVLDETVRGLSGLGFKILLDVLATAKNQRLRIVEVPYEFRDRFAGDSKLDERVVWDFGMLLVDKTLGRVVPVRFVAFSMVGGLGLVVHLAVVSAALNLAGWSFSRAQAMATGIAMIFNFALNNRLTYGDQRLRGTSWFTGLLGFMLACSVGALANVAIATYLFENRAQWMVAAVAGVAVGAVWNYAVTKVYTWGSARRF